MGGQKEILILEKVGKLLRHSTQDNFQMDYSYNIKEFNPLEGNR